MKNMIVVWVGAAAIVLTFGSLISYVVWNLMYKW